MQESTEVMKSKIEIFNKKHPVGTFVTLIEDDGGKFETQIRYRAEIMGGHTPVVWVNGLAGAYSLNRIVA